MNLRPRPVQLVDDLMLLADFLGGRQLWQPLPAYWNAGRSCMALYLMMFEGKADCHQLWQDEKGYIQAYTYLSPDEVTPIYTTPEVREWRVQIHPQQREPQLVSALIEDAEARLDLRVKKTQPITTVAYEGDPDWCDLLRQHGYVGKQALDVYMTRSLMMPISQVVVPEGFVVRSLAGEVDIPSRANVADSAFGGFEGPSEWALNDIRQMMQFCRAVQAVDLVATTLEGLVVSSAVVFCDPGTRLGEFDPVATHRGYQRRGLARALLLTGLHWMRGAGMETAVIRTGVDNVPAQRAYNSVGFEVVDRLFVYEKL